MGKIREVEMTAVTNRFWSFSGTRRKLFICSVFLMVFLFAETRVSAATVNVSSLAALQSAINSAAAGDIIVLADGTYSGAALSISTDNITVKPATPGGVYLNDAQYINIYGDYVTFSGFQFTSRAATGDSMITVFGNHDLVTQLNFDGYSAEKYIVLQGQYGEVSYCNFKNKPVTAHIGNLIHIEPILGIPGYNKIRYCSFQDMPGLGGDNGNECIRISNGETSTYISRTVVEFNYFNNTGGGDSEVISVKCRENVLRYNTFTNNQYGMMVFRHGDDNIGYGNFFINSSGIRVKEARNIYCYNNYFENSGAIGNLGSVLYVYDTSESTTFLRNINFFHNTFVECGTIDLDTGATSNTWANNIFKKSSGNIFMATSASGITWAGNQYSGTLGISIPSGMTSTNPQLALNSAGYYGLSSNSPAIDASSTNYPAIPDFTNVDDDPLLLMDISGQARSASAILKDVGCDEFGTNSTVNHPLALTDVGPVYLGGPGAAPVVSLTAPANGAGFIAPASITLTASAWDMDGTITTVDFYNGSTLIGSDTSSPYAYTWTNVAEGSYTLTVRATDNDGAVSTSAVVAAITVIPSSVTVTNFTAPGTWTWTCPGNVTAVQVECWGGGGAGGGAQRYPQLAGAAHGGGAAGGAYAKLNSYPVTPGNTYYVNVGAGGVCVLTDTSRVPGGDSWFNSANSPSSSIIAKGGAGGETVLLQNTTSRKGTGGTGTTNGSAGNVVYAGGSGGTSSIFNFAGSGGGSGGTSTNGNDGSAISGVGADAVIGGGPGGNSNPSGTAAPGQAPIAPPGGGGGGALCSNNTDTNLTGGAGAAGRVVLTYTPALWPGVNLTAPANGASFTAPASIEMTADASSATGTITTVDFYNGSTLLGSDASAPYAYTWTNVAVGSYNLTARATDNGGAVGTSAVVAITVNATNVAPSVSLTTPTNGAVFTAPASIALTVDASDTDGTVANVDFYNGSTLLGSDTTAPYAYTWMNVAAGSYNLTARATDNGGAVSTSAVAAITVNAPNVAPSVSLTAPANGASFTAPASIALTADASDTDGTVTNVGFYNGSTLLGSDTSSPYAYTWTNVAAGSYSLTARATDNNGAVSTSAVAAITVIAGGISTTNFTTAGAWTWTCPNNVTSVQVECWGGGGAGGSAQRFPQTAGGARGGGGAGGAYAKYNSYPVTPGSNYYINVGAGGVSVRTDTTRVPGGDSWFNSVNSTSSTIIAKGGAGGETVMLQNTTTRNGGGGAGTTSGSAGNVVFAGGNGGTPSTSNFGGSGGGSGGTGSAGNPGSATSGTGATAVTGGGNGGNANAVSGTAGSGQAPTTPPGGGGGGAMCNTAALTDLIGGMGSVGRVVLTYSVNAADPLAASFSASPTNGGAPLTVTFTDTSTGTITNRYWSFGDGATMNVTTTGLTHTYSFPGTNTVTLIVSDASGSSTNTKAGLIVATSVDTVGDGAPDWWRAQYFGGNGATTNADSSATSDYDNDGVNNLGEYNSDTNPTNSASRLAVTSLTILSNQARLIWTGGSSAWQFVEYRRSLMDTNGWKAIYTNTPPTAVTNTLFDTSVGSATSRFYRINAWR